MAQLSKRTHPLFNDNIEFWDLLYDAIKGGDTFITDENLFTHRLEDTIDYDKRLERAYYLNFCDAIPNIYNAYIFKEAIERPPDETLKFFREDVNGRGLTLSKFVERAGFFASVYGVVHALVAVPNLPDNKSKITKRVAKENKIYPRCSLILPTQLVDWSVDAEGNFRWVIIESTYYEDLDPEKDREEQTHYKLITTEKWEIQDSSGAAVTFEDGTPNQGTNELGYIPMVTLYHKNIDDNKIGESMLKDIIYINRAILNWCSCVDEQIERQTFSQLVVPDDGTLAEADESGDDPLHKIGTSSAWTFPSDANHPPNFISPNVQNIKTIWSLVIDHVKEIYRLARLIGSSEDMYASRSGRAAQMGFMSVNSALADKAQSYQDFENEISKLVYDELGKNPEEYESVKYPDTFDISTLTDELDSQIRVMERNFSTTLNKTIQKNIARRAVPLATKDVKSTIEDEIEQGSGIINPVNVMGTIDVDASGEDGNPNNQRMSDTFRSREDKNFDEITKKKKE